MPLKTFEEHRERVRDGREVYYEGERVEDVTTHPVLGIGFEHAALDYKLAHDPEHEELATYTDPETGEVYSRFYKIPEGTEDLLRRRELIAAGTRAGKGVVLLIKEIGTDALFALHIVAHHLDEHRGTEYLERVRAFYEYCRDNDLSHAVAQTDVKGDRSKRPSEQPHPDYYLHIVERRDEGIVVRGAKAHTTASPFVDELIVLPTRAMCDSDSDYAVSFAIPLATPGLKLIADPSSHVVGDDFGYPVSARHKMVDTLTIFDDVFVPWERVFLAGEWEYAGALANTFVQFHRFTAASYKLPMCELFIGGVVFSTIDACAGKHLTCSSSPACYFFSSWALFQSTACLCCPHERGHVLNRRIGGNLAAGRDHESRVPATGLDGIPNCHFDLCRRTKRQQVNVIDVAGDADSMVKYMKPKTDLLTG